MKGYLVLSAPLAVLTAFLTEPAFAETRVALVIGNGAYKSVRALPNPAHDAADVAAALKVDGFETILATDLDKAGMDDATIRFARAARTADVALFYYSGHAAQFEGVNYLAPIDTKLTDEADLRRMVRLDEIVSDLQQAKNLRILVLDACRDNPFAEQLQNSYGAKRGVSLQRGLAKIDTPEGMIVAYATQAGRTADDGAGRNSPYTAAFLKNIEAREEIGTIFRHISADVYEATHHEQFPELSLSLIGEFYLHGRLDMSAPPAASSDPDAIVRMDFEATERINTVPAWDAFLKQHPSGFYASLASERRVLASKAAALPQNPAPAVALNVAPKTVAPPVGEQAARGWLGVRIQSVTDEIAQSLNIKPARGALVAGVDDKGPAKPAGIEAGDVVVTFDGKDVKEPKDLSGAVADTPPGKGVDVVVIRRGREETHRVMLGRLDDSEKPQAASVTKDDPAPKPATQKALGLDLAALSKDLRDKYKIKESVKGVLITGVDKLSDAEDKRLSAGDVVVEVAQDAVSTAADIMRRIDQLKKGGKRSVLLLLSNPAGELRFVALSLQ